MNDEFSSDCLGSKVVNTACSVSNIAADDEFAACKVLEDVSNHAGMDQKAFRKLQMDDKSLSSNRDSTSLPKTFFISFILHILL